MKNKNLLKVLGIALLVTLVLTWVIPSTTIGTSGLTTGAIASIGFADIFSSIDVLLYYFATPSILILLTGALYGIINKTGAFKETVSKLASIFNRKGYLFVIISVLLFGLLAGVCNLYYELFIFVPLFIAVLNELKYNKLESVLATVGAATIGMLAKLDSSYISSMTSATENTYLLVKVVVLVVLLIFTVAYIVLYKKIFKKKLSTNTRDKALIELHERDASKNYKSSGKSVIILFILFVITLVFGFAPWSDTFTTSLSNLHSSITGFEIGNFAIIDEIMGYSTAFGAWTTSTLYSVIALLCIIFAIRGKLSFEEAIEGAVDGIKKVGSLALFALLINLFVVLALNSGFVATFAKVIMTKSNTIFVLLSSLVSNLFMVSEAYSAQYILSLIYYSHLETTIMELYGLIVQFTFGFVALIAPSSVLLMSGLYYAGEDYTKWFKYIWKFLVVVFAVILVALLVAIKFM